VLAELRYGAFKSDFVEDNLKLIDEFVKKVRVLPFADSIDVYAKEKVRLKNAGKPIEEFDLLIGCAAKAAGLTMVTHNVKHSLVAKIGLSACPSAGKAASVPYRFAPISSANQARCGIPTVRSCLPTICVGDTSWAGYPWL
jgi:hypothetical protein